MKYEDQLKQLVDKEWSITDPGKGARKYEESLLRQKKDGYKNIPFFKTISFDQAIIDMMHLFLRVADVLIDLLVRRIKELDGCQVKPNILDSQPRLKLFFTDLAVAPFNIYKPYKIEGNNILAKDYTGPQKEKLFEVRTHRTGKIFKW